MAKSTLSESERARLVELIQTSDTRDIETRIGVCIRTVHRAASGASVQPASAAVMRLAIGSKK